MNTKKVKTLKEQIEAYTGVDLLSLDDVEVSFPQSLEDEPKGTVRLWFPDGFIELEYDLTITAIWPRPLSEILFNGLEEALRKEQEERGGKYGKRENHKT